MEKHVLQQWYPNQLLVYGTPLNIMYTSKYVESPNTDTGKHPFVTLLLSEFKNTYVNANINLYYGKYYSNIIADLQLPT